MIFNLMNINENVRNKRENMKQNKQVNLLNDLYPCNQKLQGPKMVSNDCSGNIKALNLQYVSHCFFFLLTLKKRLKMEYGKNAEE